jgi:hypothetical protein
MYHATDGGLQKTLQAGRGRIPLPAKRFDVVTAQFGANVGRARASRGPVGENRAGSHDGRHQDSPFLHSEHPRAKLAKLASSKDAKPRKATHGLQSQNYEKLRTDGNA